MKNAISRILPMVALCLMGCTTTKTSSDSIPPTQPEKLKIIPSISKKNDVIKMFGEPTSKEIVNDGTERWIYSQKTKGATQTMWLRTPAPESVANSPSMKVTNEIKGEGTNQVQKVLSTPKNKETEVTQNFIVTFDGDTVRCSNLVVEHQK